MGETIRLEVGTVWENPWTKEKVKVTKIEGSWLQVEVLGTGESKEYQDINHFMKNHVST